MSGRCFVEEGYSQLAIKCVLAVVLQSDDVKRRQPTSLADDCPGITQQLSTESNLKMKAFEVHVNGTRLCLAGVQYGDELGASVDWISNPDGTTRRLNLSVLGVDTATGDYLEWAWVDLKVGDSVEVRIVEADSVDPEPRRSPGDDELDAL